MAESEKKVTKYEYFEQLEAIVKEVAPENEADLIAFIEKQKDQLVQKASKAKEKAEEKKAAGDELRKAVLAVLTTEYQTADEITSQIEGEDITRAKVIARLSQLVKSGAIEKDTTKVDNRKLTVYRLFSVIEA
jgi:ubiquinone biosynthesis protein COQ9